MKASSQEKYNKRRLRSSYVSVIISISLVLFLLGNLGFGILKSNQLINHFKEQVVISLFLKKNLNDSAIEKLQTELSQKEYTKSIVFISKEEAAEKYSQDIGEDFIEFLGSNPLKDGIDITVHAAYISQKRMDSISTTLTQGKEIQEVSYDKPLLLLLTKNIKKISVWALVFIGLLFFISMILINNSIRISIYAKRFDLKTMQMVGATKRFIRKPFVLKSIILGIISALISLTGLSLFLIYLNNQLPEIDAFGSIILLIELGLIILLLGILISWISATLATKKFLKLRTEELYY